MSWPADLERRVAPLDKAGVDQHRLLVAVARGAAPPLVIATQVGLHPASGLASFLAYVGDGERPLVVSELEGSLPARGLEFRSSGLWVDHICETPFKHWSYGLEAFALAIDDPAELLARGFGDRVPLGWELEFEATEAADLSALPAASEDIPGSGWYQQLGVVHGLLLDGSGETEIEGRSVRAHRWGSARFPADGVLADGAVGGDDPVVAGGYGVDVALPGLDEVWWVTRTPGGVRTLTDYDSRR